MNHLYLVLILPAVLAVQLHNHVGFIRFTQPVPDFLSTLSLKAQYDYKVILENETIPLNTKSADFKKWANTYNVMTQYTQYEIQQNSTKVQMEKNVTQLISQLSLVNSQISKILENGSLSIREQREAVNELAEQQYPKVIDLS
ncbi:hypothetical protein GCK72_014200 [Caenorhabditis remanei]|uniref:SXP/RAL-2 family protein Ani s 5-like cation-binding domain-containing protein n=1 Tax=Caenorhabditis remanei TaxID=31234 RepID=A0A6A5GSV8_CAERE|nr:hypothetical protein GCK72_014200 [Caenorhabditis remanei]KAF1757744.1 hypothetical protein GCK72_014200 [Caenorhabditis remanei]